MNPKLVATVSVIFCLFLTPANTAFGIKNVPDEYIKKRLKPKADEAKAFCKSEGLSTEFCILIDMKRHSGKYRMFVWDFSKNSVTEAALCCHGYGMKSSKEKPVFSNVIGSHCTALGKYKTGARSYSNWGINVHYKLHGLEKTNNNAFKRLIVLHSHTPVSSKEIYPKSMPTEYSKGCPITDDVMMRKLDDKLKKTKKPVLLWIFGD